MLNALTVDVEFFVDSNLQSFTVPSGYISERQQRLEVKKDVEALLDILAAERIPATFFVVGSVADLVPKAVMQLADAGHEVGCRSVIHICIVDQSQDRGGRAVGTLRADPKCSVPGVQRRNRPEMGVPRVLRIADGRH